MVALGSGGGSLVRAAVLELQLNQYSSNKPPHLRAGLTQSEPFARVMKTRGASVELRTAAALDAQSCGQVASSSADTITFTAGRSAFS